MKIDERKGMDMKKVKAAGTFVACVVAAFASPKPENVPELMTTFKGEKVSSVEQWEKARAPELFDTFASEEYGRWPKAGTFSVSFESDEPDRLMMGGKAIRKRIRITCTGNNGAKSFVATAFIPVCKKPVPAFLLICNRDPYENIDPTRAKKSGFWPAEDIVDRGYAAVAFWNGDVAPDWNTGNREGIFACFDLNNIRYKFDRWGTLAAWAWARAVSWTGLRRSLSLIQSVLQWSDIPVAARPLLWRASMISGLPWPVQTILDALALS